jgi:catechol 2,3-dioxygenase-like lactoylglutathione lyase family enzyme
MTEPGFRFDTIDHVQLAIPVGAEAQAIEYFAGVLGMEQVPKPEPLASRGGAWFRGGGVVIHVGADADFHPARKAHPALLVEGIEALAERLVAAGHPVRWDDELPDIHRFHTDDPFGNLIEIVAAS